MGIPHSQLPFLLLSVLVPGTSLSFPEASEVDKGRESWGPLASEERKQIPCSFHLSPQNHLCFRKLPVLPRPLMPALHSFFRLSESSIREHSSVGRLGLKEGIRHLEA